MMQTCPLCASPDTSGYHRDKQRDYLVCGQCSLVFVPAWQHLSAAEEKAVYDLHDNHDADSGYRRFLDRLCTPLRERLPASARGLDFGCGPGPTLSLMLEEAGHRMALYDPFYATDDAVWQCQYDVITATEVFEHLAHPGAEIERLVAHLDAGGWLGVMTKRVRSREAFASWHYIRDPTHVAFFADATFAWLGQRFGLNVELVDADVVLMQKR
ncbi:class I SAM-dependent methyltransferase [Halomonas sp. 18H]|uniref:class I SAM-dependent methyltransferase n=1 Tax=Halomonas almeriensis TaxID=308163 RepID=UPI00222FB092|nr:MULTISPECIES: class I SAM-dependent methyltransferase [Halomonas]MCW4149203.1 class I SAM-dependent methyltransferase [Halomonas sp. 18H]MDN3552247.1 class I SAM-dependent methyltransferase [Halomonas almeriensis]